MTVATGVTVPRPMSVMGISPARALIVTTGIGPPLGERPPLALVAALGVSSFASTTSPTMTNTMTNTRRVKRAFTHPGRVSELIGPCGEGVSSFMGLGCTDHDHTSRTS
ncbi:MAG: hypothetical protein ACHQ06_06170 [Candidatus Dormibacteria bacterium]